MVAGVALLACALSMAVLVLYRSACALSVGLCFVLYRSACAFLRSVVFDGVCFIAIGGFSMACALLRLTACALLLCCFAIDGLCFVSFRSTACALFRSTACVLLLCDRWLVLYCDRRLSLSSIGFVLVLPIACQYKQVCLLLRLWGLFPHLVGSLSISFVVLYRLALLCFID